MITEFRWYVGSAKGCVKSPQWADIEAALHEIENASGDAKLETFIQKPDGGLKCFSHLSVSSENGLHFLSILDEDNEVRSLFLPDREPGEVDIFGLVWDNRMVTNDFSLVYRAFREYFETGNVSTDLLN